MCVGFGELEVGNGGGVVGACGSFGGDTAVWEGEEFECACEFGALYMELLCDCVMICVGVLEIKIDR
jgi:hypothetical protein